MDPIPCRNTTTGPGPGRAIWARSPDTPGIGSVIVASQCLRRSAHRIVPAAWCPDKSFTSNVHYRTVCSNYSATGADTCQGSGPPHPAAHLPGRRSIAGSTGRRRRSVASWQAPATTPAHAASRSQIASSTPGWHRAERAVTWRRSSGFPWTSQQALRRSRQRHAREAQDADLNGSDIQLKRIERGRRTGAIEDRARKDAGPRAMRDGLTQLRWQRRWSRCPLRAHGVENAWLIAVRDPVPSGGSTRRPGDRSQSPTWPPVPTQSGVANAARRTFWAASTSTDRSVSGLVTMARSISLCRNWRITSPQETLTETPGISVSRSRIASRGSPAEMSSPDADTQCAPCARSRRLPNCR